MGVIGGVTVSYDMMKNKLLCIKVTILQQTGEFRFIIDKSIKGTFLSIHCSRDIHVC